ncbi:hypothetical protein L6452_37249 [Arctium lappa]|uniref:Uncharacterized protein n=1 Tax=Arctium lappa TaxID=4217 RepID=A0ACB8Y2Z0_ARCLA|nr:hypothetical protein L6452_37249 [Arctium lappa]
MPSFPQPGSVTICEINRDLITAQSISDDQAKETYGKILVSSSFLISCPIPYQLDYPPSQSPDRGVEPTVNRLWGLLQAVSYGPLKSLVGSDDERLLPSVDLRCLSWHQKKDILAFVSARNQVTIRDYGDSGEGKDPCVLMNDLQREVKLLEWRPNAGKTLSVACKGGICIWSASYPGNSACVRSGINSGSLSRASGVRWTLVDFLRTSASYESSSFTIWDVAQGVGTPIRRGLGSISLLKWSPTGDYFFAAKFDGTFYLWETNTWTSEPWSSTSGFVTDNLKNPTWCAINAALKSVYDMLGAAWDPDGRMILIAFSESSTLGSIHFATKPPSLDAQLFPVDLPELKSLTNSCHHGDHRKGKKCDTKLLCTRLCGHTMLPNTARTLKYLGFSWYSDVLPRRFPRKKPWENGKLLKWDVCPFLPRVWGENNRMPSSASLICGESLCLTSGGIEKIAWDASGERLAVSYKDGNELYKGLIAIYDVKRATLITPSLIGFIRGPGDDTKPLTFSFHDKFKQGPLLSVVMLEQWNLHHVPTHDSVFVLAYGSWMERTVEGRFSDLLQEGRNGKTMFVGIKDVLGMLRFWSNFNMRNGINTNVFKDDIT